jgi:glycosyltransferase involved in cell wall biosynthesis
VRIYYIGLPPRVHRALRERHYGVRFYYFLWQRAAGRFARELQGRERFDLFHQITFSNDWMPSFIAPALSAPFVWGPVGGGQKVPPELMGTLARRERRQERTRNLLQGLWRATPARRRCVRKASAILVCNRETKEVLARWQDKLIDFPVNGIDPAEAAAGAPVPRPAAGFSLLYVGRFDAIKGLPLALEAFRLFLEEAPEATLELVGEGPERPRLEEMAVRLGIAERLVWTPWATRDQVLKRMRRSDAFLFPSLRDGGGAVVVEAMACGLPVVCLDVGGPGFHVRDDWGVKIAPGAPAEVAAGLSRALNRLRRDPAWRAGLSAAARARASAYYSWDRLGERLRGVFSSVLTGRPEGERPS